jgi:hypothetical protein
MLWVPLIIYKRLFEPNGSGSHHLGGICNMLGGPNYLKCTIKGKKDLDLNGVIFCPIF